jgi:hypothetical protein
MISARVLRAPLNWTVAGLSVLDLAVAVLRADGVRTNSGVSVLAKPAGSGRMKQGPLHV